MSRQNISGRPASILHRIWEFLTAVVTGGIVFKQGYVCIVQFGHFICAEMCLFFSEPGSPGRSQPGKSVKTHTHISAKLQHNMQPYVYTQIKLPQCCQTHRHSRCLSPSSHSIAPRTFQRTTDKHEKLLSKTHVQLPRRARSSSQL